MGATVPRRHSLGNDRLHSKTPRPASWWARADGGCRPPRALLREQPPPQQDPPSPQLVGPHLWGAAIPRKRSLGSDRLLGRTPRPSSWWGLPCPAGAPYATTTTSARLPVPPAGEPAPMGPTVPRRRSLGNDHHLGKTPRPASW